MTNTNIERDKVEEIRTVHDPFLGKSVEVSNRLIDRLRGHYACGPTLANGQPEFGWREFETPPIQRDAADEIERLRSLITVSEKRAEESDEARTVLGNALRAAIDERDDFLATIERLESIAKQSRSSLMRVREALELVRRGLKRGKIPDQSILRWHGSEDLTALSTIIDSALSPHPERETQ